MRFENPGAKCLHIWLSVKIKPQCCYVIEIAQSSVFPKIASQSDHALKLDWKRLSLEEAHVWGMCSLRSWSLGFEQQKKLRLWHGLLLYFSIGFERNFKKYSHGQVDRLGAPYDTKSIMHLPRNSWSRNRMNTIESRAGAHVVLGQMYGLSEVDKQQLNQLYKCKNNYGKKSGADPGFWNGGWSFVIM